MKKLLLTLLMLGGVYGVYAQVPPCNLAFSLSIPPNTSQTVALTNNSLLNNGAGFTSNLSISWGDNSTTSIPSVQGLTFNHTYSAPGTYTVTLSGTTLDSMTQVVACSSSTSQQTTVATLPCASSISQVNNGSGSYTFTANNVGGGTNMTYAWNFGDGTSGTGSSVSHTYAFSGSYTVTLVATNGVCQFTTSTTINYFNGLINCSQYTTAFGASASGYNAMFNNYSNGPGVPGMSITRTASWNFGDGSTATNTFGTVNHTYTTAGTYTVTMVNNWVDSFTNVVYCTGTSSQTLVITAPPPASNVIQGTISWDSLSINTANTSFKVWLIEHNATANTLTAVDSTTVSGNSVASYSFSGHPAGFYRTKAAPLSGTTAAATLMPTYADSSLYWNTAVVINHTGGTSNANIWMKSGNPTGGPGFIGGNISQGANKGTGAGVPDLLVALLSPSGQLVRFTYTDVNGDYSFSSLPHGTYVVFPESMNYATTPSSSLTISGSQNMITGVLFKHTSTEIKPIPSGLSDLSDKGSFSIYPNPAKGNIYIGWNEGMTGDASISIVDIAGREVMSQSVKVSGSTRVDVSALQQGVYLIKITTGDVQHVEKLILQH